MQAVASSPVVFATSPAAKKDLLHDALCTVAGQLWSNGNVKAGASRRERIMRHYLGDIFPSISPHLQVIKNCAGVHDVYLISQARTGSLAFGATIDDRFPPSPPHFSFCPCCQARSPDTLAHHFMGLCSTTKHIADAFRPMLMQFMSDAVPEWLDDYEDSKKDGIYGDCTALLLAAGDEDFADPAGKTYAVQLVAKWLRQIIDIHPLCSRQSRGEHFSQLRYCDRTYRKDGWSATECRALVSTDGSEPDSVLQSLCPGRTAASIKTKRFALRALWQYRRETQRRMLPIPPSDRVCARRNKINNNDS